MQKNKKTKKHRSNHDLYNDLEKIKAALREATSDVKGKAGELLSQSWEDAEDGTAAIKDDFTNYVGEKPFKSLGIAVLTGVVIGYILHK